jgi:hypothetical protein
LGVRFENQPSLEILRRVAFQTPLVDDPKNCGEIWDGILDAEQGRDERAREQKENVWKLRHRQRREPYFLSETARDASDAAVLVVS